MENVAYLEIEDFDSDGNLKPYVGQGKACVIMAQGSFCGYCQQAKPAFQKFANSSKNVVACSIEIDGTQSERDAAKFLNKWDPQYRGVPHYIGFGKDGKFKKVHNGGRDTGSIIAFAGSL